MFARTLTMGSTSAGNRTFLIKFPPASSEPAPSDSDVANHVHGLLRDALLRALPGRLRARDVDLLRRLGDLREDRDAIGLHFGEPVGDREVLPLLSAPVPELAGAEDGEQWRVSRQHAEVPLG